MHTNTTSPPFHPAPPPLPSGPEPRDTRRVSALWLGATGAFLLVLAAGVFAAVNWDAIPEAAKIGALGAVTGGSLLAGWSMRASLPAVATVLRHLGAYLVPITGVAFCARADLGWRPTALLTGLAGVAAFGLRARVARSPMLHVSALAAAVVATVGGSGLAGVPAPLSLAALAAAGAVSRRAAHAVAFGVTATAALVLPGAAVFVRSPHVHDLLASSGRVLGIGGNALVWVGPLTGVIAAAACLAAARFRASVAVAATALATLAVGVAAGFVQASVSAAVVVLIPGTAFALVECAAVGARRDPLLDALSRRLATACEWALAGVCAFALLHGLPLVFATGLWPRFTSTPAGAGFALLAVGAVLGTVRRHLVARELIVTLGPALVSFATAALVTFGLPLAPATALLVAGVAVLALPCLPAYPGVICAAGAAAVVAVWFSGIQPWHTWESLSPQLRLYIVGGLAVVAASYACLVATSVVRRYDAGTAMLAVVGAALTVVCAGVAVTQWFDPPTGATVVVVAGWVLAAFTSRLDRTMAVRMRGLALVPLAFGWAWYDPSRAVWSIPVLAVGVCCAAEYVRDRRPGWAHAAIALTTLAAGHAAFTAGVDPARIALAAGGVAALCAGVAASLGLERSPLASGAAANSALATVAAFAIDATFGGVALVACGAGLVAWAHLGHVPSLAHAGAFLAVVGTTIAATDGGHREHAVATTWPIAAYLLGYGVLLRRRATLEGRRLPTWIAYTPALVLAAGAPMVERFRGGSDLHVLAAAAVLVLAVACGAWFRLAGPLFAGTALLVTLAVEEAAAGFDAVPTWGWLSIAGSILIGAAVLLERSATGPLELGRRAVTFVAARFE